MLPRGDGPADIDAPSLEPTVSTGQDGAASLTALAAWPTIMPVGHQRSVESELDLLVRSVVTGRIDKERALVRAHRLGAAEAFLELLEMAQGGSSPTLVLDEHDPDAGPAPVEDRRIIGRHEVEAELGRGAMGIVYRAREIALDRTVALKVLVSGRDADEESIARFLREARTAAQVRHENLVEIYEVGRDGDVFFYSMEYVPGRTLSDRLANGPLPAEPAARIVRDAARGLAAAHQAGIVHRDVKPSNLLLDEADRVHVTDFGLGKSLAGGHDLTRTGVVMGTPVFMPPEQARADADAIGPASDVYSLAATLYTALTGRFLFEADRPTLDLLSAIQKEEPPRPSSLVPRLPRDLETIVLVGLEKDPRRRYADAGALADDLDRFLAREPILARPPGRVRRAVLWARRRPARAAMLAGVLLAAATFAGVTAGRRAFLEASLDEAMAAGRTRFEAGDLAGALEEFEAALALAPDHQEAQFRRVQAAQALAEAGLADLRRGDRSGAEERLAALETMRGPGAAEAAEKRRLFEALARDAALRSDLERSLEAIGRIRDGEELRLAVDAIRRLLADLASRDLEPRFHRQLLDRVAGGILVSFRLAQVLVDSSVCRTIEGLFPELARDASFEEWAGTRADVSLEVESDDWLGTRVPLEASRLRVHAHELADGRWSGDQEATVRDQMRGPGLPPGFQLRPGRYLLAVESEGHLPARWLMEVYPSTRVRVRLRLFRARDVGLPVVLVPSPSVEIEDRLEGAAEDTPRAKEIAHRNEILTLIARVRVDFFVSTYELTGAQLARIVRVAPRAGWCPTGWRLDPWGPGDGEEQRPVRGITRAEAQWIAGEASRILLPEDLARAWQFDLPVPFDRKTGTVFRLSGDPHDRLFPPKEGLPDQPEVAWGIRRHRAPTRLARASGSPPRAGADRRRWRAREWPES